MSVPWPTSGSYPIRDGNSVQPLIDGVPTFRRIGEAIERAQNSIWLTVAFCAPDFVIPDGRGALFDQHVAELVGGDGEIALPVRIVGVGLGEALSDGEAVTVGGQRLRHQVL